jgi:hypothetical protein
MIGEEGAELVGPARQRKKDIGDESGFLHNRGDPLADVLGKFGKLGDGKSADRRLGHCILPFRCMLKHAASAVIASAFVFLRALCGETIHYRDTKERARRSNPHRASCPCPLSAFFDHAGPSFATTPSETRG